MLSPPFVSILPKPQENNDTMKNASLTASENQTLWQRLKGLDHALNQSSLVWIRDSRGQLTYINDYACQITGYRRQDILNTIHFFHKPDAYPEDYIAQILKHVKQEQNWKEEMLCLTPEGTSYWLEVSTTPLFNEDSHLIDQFISISHVITERKRVETALQRFETGLKSLTSLQSDNTLSFKQKAQQALKVMMGYFNIPLALFIRPLEDPRAQQNFGIYFFSGSVRGKELLHYVDLALPLIENNSKTLSRHTLSQPPFCSVWGKSLYDSQMQKLGVLTFFDEKCELKFSTTEDQEFFALFSQWLASLIEREQFIERITESNANKDRLMTVLAHDLRSPLSAVSGFTELLLDNAAGHPEQTLAEHQDMLESLQEASHRSLILIQSILEFERLGEKSYVPQFHTVNFDVWVKMYLKAPLMQADRYLLSTQIESSKETLWVNVDEPVFARVITNIVQNACKFTPSGGELSIRIFKDLLGDLEMAHLEICDTGIGIPEDKLKLVFSREDNIRRPGLRGEPSNGMGLAIARRIVELHKGYLRIKSAENKGTCVSILLPLTQKQV
jgi:PAS domain S-box-containing protein